MTEILLGREVASHEQSAQIFEDAILEASVQAAKTPTELLGAVRLRVEDHCVPLEEAERLKNIHQEPLKSMDYFAGYMKSAEEAERLKSLYLGAAAHDWAAIREKAYEFMLDKADEKTLRRHLYGELNGLMSKERLLHGAIDNTYRHNLGAERSRVYYGKTWVRWLRNFGRMALEI